jgi:hypothetical protein
MPWSSYHTYGGRGKSSEIGRVSWVLSQLMHVFTKSPTGKADIEQVELDEPPVIGFRPLARTDTEVSFWLSQNREAMAESEKIRHRWHEAVRRVIEKQRQLHGRPPPCPSPRFAHLTSMAVGALLYRSISKLKQMTISSSHQPNEKHGALVRSLQFSPDGRYLVTSRYA